MAEKEDGSFCCDSMEMNVEIAEEKLVLWINGYWMY